MLNLQAKVCISQIIMFEDDYVTKVWEHTRKPQTKCNSKSHPKELDEQKGGKKLSPTYPNIELRGFFTKELHLFTYCEYWQYLR